MTRIAALLFLLSAGSFAAGPEGAVQEAANAWRRAVVKQDESALRQFLAEDLLYSHSNGTTHQNKTEYIAAVAKGPSRYESFTDSETTIRVYGNAAVLSGYVDVKLAGRESYRVRTLEVYVKNKGQWQMTAHQSARVSR